MDASIAAYDNTFFAGTACELNLTAPAVDLICEVCNCPMDLGTYVDPMEEVCGGPATPSNLPILDDLVDLPSGAMLAWTPDPTVAVEAMGCDPVVTTYMGQVTCDLDGSGILIASYTMTVYPTLTVTTETAPDCDADGGLVEITSPDGTVCFTMVGTPGVPGDCASAVDGDLTYDETFFAGTACEQNFANTLSTSCATEVDCDGNSVCTVSVISQDVMEVCAGGAVTFTAEDLGTRSFDGIDVYIVGDDGSTGGPFNFWTNTTPGTADIAVTPAAVQGCDPETVNYVFEVYCWQDDVDLLISGPAGTVTVYPELTLTTVNPDCAGGAGSHTVTSPDGTVCDVVTGVGGADYCVMDGDAVADASLPAYSMTFFAGTDCELVLAADAVDINCETCTTLPVQLKSMIATAFDRFNLIEWETSSESFSDYQAIERSENGVNGWNEIGRVLSTNTSFEASYDVKDRSPLEISYYRLKSVDLNGEIGYSNTVVVERRMSVNMFKSFVSPNPFVQTVFLEIESPRNQQTTIQLISVDGRVLKTMTRDVEIGFNKIAIDTDEISSGVYFLNTRTSDYESVEKIIKLD